MKGVGVRGGDRDGRVDWSGGGRVRTGVRGWRPRGEAGDGGRGQGRSNYGVILFTRHANPSASFF